MSRDAGAPLILAIETSNPTSGPGSVALGTSAALLGTERVGADDATGTRGGDDLVPAIDRLFAAMGTDRSRLARIGVSVGPGGFTSLRIASAVAAMLGESLGAEVVPIPTASVVAHGIEVFPTLVLLGIKGERAYASWFDAPPNADGPAWAREVGSHEIAGLEPRVVVCDPSVGGPFVDAAADAGITTAAPEFRAESCLVLARSATASPDGTAPVLYPREPEAVRKWRELHG